MGNDEYNNLQKTLIIAEAELLLARKHREAFVLDALKQAQITGAYLPPNVFKDKRMLETAIRLLSAIAGIVEDA